MHLVAHDVRYGVRLLWKAPWFSAIALVTLGLGIGAATSIFSVVDSVLLRPLPFQEPARLAVIWEKNPAQNKFKLFVAAGNFRDWQQQSYSWQAMAAIQDVRINLTGGPNGHIDPEELRAERVSAGLFPLLGVQPILGRAFRPEEDQFGHSNYALLSHRLWERRFGADPQIAGKAIRLREQSYTVLGVLPSGFQVLDPSVDIWLPLGIDFNDARAAAGRSLVVVARLRPGITLDGARTEMERVGDALERNSPALNTGSRPSVFSFKQELVGNTQEALLVLLGAVGCLLLMACANVANLQLARGAGRRREIAIRKAIGAGTGRILVQLFSESCVLALAGGVAGLVLAQGGMILLAHLGPRSIPRLAEAHLDVPVFLFALGISLLTGILCGLAPALQASGTHLSAALSETGRGRTAGRGGRAVRNSLVVTEVALSVVVLIAAGLLIRSFVRLRATDPGFQPDGLLTWRLPMAGGRNFAVDRRIAFLHQVEDRISGLPGVRAVGAANSLPLTGLGVGLLFTVDGRPAPPRDQKPMGLVRSVSPSYFRAMGIPLVTGRGFTWADTSQSPPAVIVNQTLVRRFWPHGNPLGGRLLLEYANVQAAEIVGVVGDVKPDRLEGEEWPTIYSPYPQAPAFTMALVMRTDGSPLALASTIEKTVHQLDPDQPVADVGPMEGLVDQAVAATRFNAVLLGIFAVIAFTLGAVGIYSVMAYDVSERTHEIGLRMALGAQSRDVLQLIVGQGALLAAYGIAAGLLASFAVTRLMVTMLYGVKATDVDTFVAISLLLGGVALAASYLPSRRAMALDPMTALRHE